MAILKDSSKITVGQNINSLTTEAAGHINRLKQLKTDLLGIRGNMATDTATYSAADLAEFDAVLQTLNNSLNNI